MSLSPDQREYAARLLRKAREDLAAVRALLDNESIAAEFRCDEPEAAGFDRAESLRSAERAMGWAQEAFDAAA